jgi:hypothetical protein
LPKLKDKLYKLAPNYIIKLNYNLIKPNIKEVEEFGYKKARILRSLVFCSRAERLIYKAFPKAKAFYYNLIEGSNRKMDINNYEIDIDIFKSKEEEKEEEEEKKEIGRESTEY